MFDNITSGLFWLFVFFLFFGRKTFPILIIGGLIYAVLVWGSPRMIIGAGFVVAGVVSVATLRGNLEATSAVLNRKKHRRKSRTEHNAELEAEIQGKSSPAEIAADKAYNQQARTIALLGGHRSYEDAYGIWHNL